MFNLPIEFPSQHVVHQLAKWVYLILFAHTNNTRKPKNNVSYTMTRFSRTLLYAIHNRHKRSKQLSWHRCKSENVRNHISFTTLLWEKPREFYLHMLLVQRCQSLKRLQWQEIFLTHHVREYVISGFVINQNICGDICLSYKLWCLSLIRLGFYFKTWFVSERGVERSYSTFEMHYKTNALCWSRVAIVITPRSRYARAG